MEDTSKRFCSLLFDILEQKGIKDIVCSPGSRNVPLLLAAAARESLKKHFVVDERSAAFVGLGLSIVSKRPIVLICTSGSALLDYAPAIAEAYYQSIPLIVVSADRPIQWIDQDDSQTIRQDGALDNYVKKSYSIPAYGEDNKELLWYVNRVVNDAVSSACSWKKGPVHINVHLSEPLEGKIQKSQNTQRIINSIEADSIGNKETIRNLAQTLADSKVMLVAGFNQPDSKLQKSITEFSRFKNVTVMAETISNLHLKAEDYCVDTVLTAYSETNLDEISPDIIISIGGALISRKLKEYLRRNVGKCQHWAVGFSHTTTDPFMSMDLKIEVEPARFFKNLTGALKKIKLAESKSEFQSAWSQRKKDASKVKDAYIENVEWSELKAFDFILKNISSNCNLFLSNGTAIRYAQIINYPLPHASYCNRGVSGIDGSVSTAIGGALGFGGKTLLITGDLSLAYDIGSLALKEIPDSFKIIVIDNLGGGIFRFIPSTSNLPEREEYLCQPPLLPLKDLAKGYNWNFYECDSSDSLKSVFPDFLNSNKKSILKVTCPAERSAEILKTYMKIKVD